MRTFWALGIGDVDGAGVGVSGMMESWGERMEKSINLH